MTAQRRTITRYATNRPATPCIADLDWHTEAWILGILDEVLADEERCDAAENAAEIANEAAYERHLEDRDVWGDVYDRSPYGYPYA
jgi:hypothetical protein